MTYFVYSTATNSTYYCDYPPPDPHRSHHTPIKRVLIKGGHGLASQLSHSGPGNIFTPQGVVTQVSDEDMEWLQKNDSFREHIEKGFLIVDKRRVEPSNHARNMTQKDGSAPLIPKDFEKSQYSDDKQSVYKTKENVEIPMETMAPPPSRKRGRR